MLFAIVQLPFLLNNSMMFALCQKIFSKEKDVLPTVLNFHLFFYNMILLYSDDLFV